MSQQVTINYKKDGTRTIEVQGVPGDECNDITLALTRANEVLETHETAEAHVLEAPEFVQSYNG